MEDESGEPAVLMGEEEKAVDKYYVTYFLFYALGVVTLVPSNFYTTATDYWLYKFRDPDNETYNSDNRTSLQTSFFSNYSIVANVSTVVFVGLTIRLIPKFSTIQRIIASLSGVLLMFGLTLCFVASNTDSWQHTFYVVTLVIGFFLTGFCMVFMVSIFEMVPKFPPGYIVGILTGQAICGIFGALAQVFSVAIGAKASTNGLVYFLIGLAFVFIVLMAFIINFLKSPFFRQNFFKVVERTKLEITKEILFATLHKTKYYLLSVCVISAVTSMIIPGVTTLITSVDKGSRWNDDFFVPVVTFLLYFTTDYLGRELAGFIKYPKNGPLLLVVSLIRVSLVPLIMFCNAQPRHHLSVIFNDYTYIVFMLILAFSNGFITNLCVLYIPIVTETVHERRLAMILILILMLIVAGVFSLVSSALVKAL